MELGKSSSDAKQKEQIYFYVPLKRGKIFLEGDTIAPNTTPQLRHWPKFLSFHLFWSYSQDLLIQEMIKTRFLLIVFINIVYIIPRYFLIHSRAAEKTMFLPWDVFTNAFP